MKKRWQSLDRLSTCSVNSSRTTHGALQDGPAASGGQENPRVPKVPPRPSPQTLTRFKLQKQSSASKSRSLPRSAACPTRLNYADLNLNNPSASALGEKGGDGRTAAATAGPVSPRQQLSKSASHAQTNYTSVQIAEGSPRNHIRKPKFGSQVLRRKSTPASPHPFGSAGVSSPTSPGTRRALSVLTPAEEVPEKPDASSPQTETPRRKPAALLKSKSVEACGTAHPSPPEPHTVNPSTSQSSGSARVKDAQKGKIFQSMAESGLPGGNISAGPHSPLKELKQQPNSMGESSREKQNSAQPLRKESQSDTVGGTQPKRPPRPSKNLPARPPPPASAPIPIPRPRKHKTSTASSAAVATSQQLWKKESTVSQDNVMMTNPSALRSASGEKKKSSIPPSQNYVVMTTPSSVVSARGERKISEPTLQNYAAEAKEEADGAYSYVDLMKSRNWMPWLRSGSSKTKEGKDIVGHSQRGCSQL